ncbi:MAG: hypothetical protein NXI30_02660 [bacterium]|nr:hypothetical protein [bacterium]
MLGRKFGRALSAAMVALSGSVAIATEREDFNEDFEDFDWDEPVPISEAGDPETVGRAWGLSGSVEISGSINPIRHESAAGNDYTGLQRLRSRLNLALELDLPADWDLRVEGWGFWDAAYLANGRSNYTEQVRNRYELDADVGEAWIRGEIASDVELKLGRQIVIWGRSDTLRVLDVLNPIDSREPARADLEDLRLPVAMARVDVFASSWRLQALWIPEIRFDRSPVAGSDFFPSSTGLGEERPDSVAESEVAASLVGTFSGWDLSLNGAWFWNDRPRLRRDQSPTTLVHDRLWLVGGSGNLVRGGWLFKMEVALLGGLEFFNDRRERLRFDGLAGVEYFGLENTTLSLDFANRHIFRHRSAIREAPDFARQDSQEVALRISRSFFDDRLHCSILGLLFGIDARDGSIIRVDLDYDLLDGLVVGAGVLLFQEGDLPPLDRWEKNDRILFRGKWSF